MKKTTLLLTALMLALASTGCQSLRSPQAQKSAAQELSQAFAREMWDLGIRATNETCAEVTVELTGYKVLPALALRRA